MKCSNTQEQKVLSIVQKAGENGIRTEQVKIEAMYQGVSCADRYLRWLAQSEKVWSKKEEGNKTKTWRITPGGELNA